MSVSQAVASHLPSLRRFARALTGSQGSGDACVVAVLEALARSPSIFPSHLDAKIALYRMLSQSINSTDLNISSSFKIENQHGEGGSLQALTPRPRQAFFLLAVEGFDLEAIAAIMEIDISEIAELIAAADMEIASQINTANILIIEDDLLTSSYLEELITGLGHRLTGVATTHQEAVKLAKGKKPDLVLSDIQLADDSSGVAAVNEILGMFEVPVIFITAHPEMLLTGEKPEPAFLITKPFNTGTVKAVIGQALYFEVRSRASAASRVLTS